MRLTLPYPVSANRYWRRNGVRLHVSAEANAYKRTVATIAALAHLQPFDGPVMMTVKLTPKNRICMDLDNALKVTIDALKGIAYSDDKQVQKIVAERCKPDGKGSLEVDIEAYKIL